MAAQSPLDFISCSIFRRPQLSRDSTTSTVYTPLVPKKSQIRLLTLQPGQFDEDIRCSLYIVSLKRKPQYEALSYLWGDTNITLPVIVNDKVIQITANLEAALRHLRWRQKSRILWVDAICINQQDIEEKNIQVPMMGDIYRLATSALAWFGHGDDHVTKAITWAQYHILHQTSEATLEWSDLETAASMDEDGQYINFFRLSHALFGCLLLLQHEYWRRMWTFQEFVISQKLPICVYGHFNFSMLSILEAIETLHKCLLGCRSAANATFRKKTQVLWNNTQKEFSEWGGNLTARAQLETMIREGELARDLSEVRLHALDYLLMITAGRKSSDPRDRIYALYGLIPALSERFPTDYSKTEKQVVLEAISSVVQNRCRYLWINFRLRQDRFTSKALPSWCPDFDRPYQYFRPTVTCEALKFSSSSMGVNRISADLTTCHLWSWNLGYCKVIGRIGLGNHVEKAEALRSTNARLFKPARELWAFLVGLDTHGNAMAQEYRQRFARLAVSDLEGHDQVSDEELFDALEAVSIDARKVVTELPVKPAFDLVYRIQATREAVTCVVTSHGCVALTPIDTEDNDLIILPRHPTPPMVLRKEYSDLSHSDQEFYLMTGPAQIDILGSKGPHVDDAVSIVQQFGVTEYLLH